MGSGIIHSFAYAPAFRRGPYAIVVETKGPTPVVSGVMATGEIPRLTTFEDTGITREAFLDERMKTPDPVRDDQALFFRVPEGIVVLVGCAHAGIVNTLRYVSELTGERRIYAVLGGTHLITASPERIRETIAALKRYEVQKIMLLHCTGIRAFADLSKALPGRCDWPGAGARVEFGVRLSGGSPRIPSTNRNRPVLFYRFMGDGVGLGT